MQPSRNIRRSEDLYAIYFTFSESLIQFCFKFKFTLRKRFSVVIVHVKSQIISGPEMKLRSITRIKVTHSFY